MMTPIEIITLVFLGFCFVTLVALILIYGSLIKKLNAKLDAVGNSSSGLDLLVSTVSESMQNQPNWSWALVLNDGNWGFKQIHFNGDNVLDSSQIVGWSDDFEPPVSETLNDLASTLQEWQDLIQDGWYFHERSGRLHFNEFDRLSVDYDAEE